MQGHLAVSEISTGYLFGELNKDITLDDWARKTDKVAVQGV